MRRFLPLSRLPICLWRRRWWVLAAILLGMLIGALDAHAQERTFIHEFEDRTVYIEVAEYWVEVWSRSDGQCVMYPSAPEVSAGQITFAAGTTWEVAAVETGIEITFPSGRTVLYERTDTEPERICAFHGRDT
jgi:hypothetical protein